MIKVKTYDEQALRTRIVYCLDRVHSAGIRVGKGEPVIGQPEQFGELADRILRESETGSLQWGSE